MNLPLWVTETAEMFWAEAGEQEPFPRNLRRTIAHTLPLTVVFLPKLRLADIDTWLTEHANLCGVGLQDRTLRACLIATYGHGIVFLDGADAAEEQRFSLAHELAHFLRDYCRPRQLASERVGPDVLAVFDGERPPYPHEQIHALLAGIRIGVHIHLMERSPDGKPTTASIDQIEQNANLLAYELLAPSALVLQAAQSVSGEERNRFVAQLLQEQYGLPAASAMRYAAILVPPSSQPTSLMHRLGLVP